MFIFHLGIIADPRQCGRQCIKQVPTSPSPSLTLNQHNEMNNKLKKKKEIHRVESIVRSLIIKNAIEF